MGSEPNSSTGSLSAGAGYLRHLFYSVPSSVNQVNDSTYFVEMCVD